MLKNGWVWEDYSYLHTSFLLGVSRFSGAIVEKRDLSWQRCGWSQTQEIVVTTTFFDQGSCGHRAQIQEHVDASSVYASRHVFGGFLLGVSSLPRRKGLENQRNSNSKIFTSELRWQKCHLFWLKEKVVLNRFLPACNSSLQNHSGGCSQVELLNTYSCLVFCVKNARVLPKVTRILMATWPA